MDIVAAYQLAGSYRGAAQICGTTHRTVKRVVTLAIASHWAFDQWGRFLPEHTTAVSMLDRLLHHANVIITDGESHRMRQAKARKGAAPQTP